MNLSISAWKGFEAKWWRDNGYKDSWMESWKALQYPESEVGLGFRKLKDRCKPQNGDISGSLRRILLSRCTGVAKNYQGEHLRTWWLLWLWRKFATFRMKQLQSMERMHSYFHFHFYYYFEHEAWDLLRPLTQMALSWNWFRKVGRDQDHCPPCWVHKRMNKD